MGNYLDDIRMNSGKERCRSEFEKIYRSNRQKGVHLLNSGDVEFPTIFLLMKYIKENGIYPLMNERNQICISVTDKILQNNKNDFNVKSDKNHNVFKWMIETGTDCDLGDVYNRIIDVLIIILIDTYKDKSILPYVNDLIFRRCENEEHYHNLIWGYLKFKDRDCLKLIAENINSENDNRSELACKLLNIESKNKKSPDQKKKLYNDYMNWMSNNKNFLYFTEESLQFSGKPQICKVDLERKYLCRKDESYNSGRIVPKEEREKQAIDCFKHQDKDNRKMLSDYSFKIHEEDFGEWEKWMDIPVDEQIKSAKQQGRNVK